MFHFLVFITSTLKLFVSLFVCYALTFLGFNLDYTILYSIAAFFLLILMRVKPQSLPFGTMAIIMFGWAFASFSNLFPHSWFYFFIHGNGKTFLFS